MKQHLQFSLRELLIVVLFAGLGLASLRTGGIIGSIVVMLAIVVTTAFAIVAFVGRHSSQAFAIGFVIPVILYAVVVLAVGKSELDPYAGRLLTSRLLRPMFGLIAKKIWTNVATGQVVPDYDPTTDPNRFASPMGLSESPDRPTFMSLGHVLFDMLLGYAGARFALLVYRKQPEH